MYTCGKFYFGRHSLAIAILLCATFLCSCVLKPPRPLTFEEQQIYMAKQQCEQEATDMNPSGPYSSNPFWSAYFEMCMNRFGIPDSALRNMWY